MELLLQRILFSAVNKAHHTDQSVRIVLTPKIYSIKKPLVLTKNITLTTFNPVNGGKTGPWVVSDIKSGKFARPGIDYGAQVVHYLV